MQYKNISDFAVIRGMLFWNNAPVGLYLMTHRASPLAMKILQNKVNNMKYKIVDLHTDWGVKLNSSLVMVSVGCWQKWLSAGRFANEFSETKSDYKK